MRTGLLYGAARERAVTAHITTQGIKRAILKMSGVAAEEDGETAQAAPTIKRTDIKRVSGQRKRL